MLQVLAGSVKCELFDGGCDFTLAKVSFASTRVRLKVVVPMVEQHVHEGAQQQDVL